VPLNEIHTIYLDSESRTSVLLTKLLADRFWKLRPEYVSFNFANSRLNTDMSYLLIGDKALRHCGEFRYVYDLAEEWIKFTSLPFVFACWTSNKDLDSSFVAEFNEALKFGVNNIDKAVEKYTNGFEREYALRYLADNVSFNLSADKRKGLAEFWSLALEELKSKVRWFG